MSVFSSQMLFIQTKGKENVIISAYFGLTVILTAQVLLWLNSYISARWQLQLSYLVTIIVSVKNKTQRAAASSIHGGSFYPSKQPNAWQHSGSEITSINRE